MRLKPRVLFAALGLVVGVAVAVQQSPNFSSLTTELRIVTSDSRYPVRLTVPLPYREPQQALLPPVPAGEFDQTWPLSERGIGIRADHPAKG